MRLYLNCVKVGRSAATANREVRCSNPDDGFCVYTFFYDKISSFYPDLHLNWVKILFKWVGIDWNVT